MKQTPLKFLILCGPFLALAIITFLFYTGGRTTRDTAASPGTNMTTADIPELKSQRSNRYVLGFDTPTDPVLQSKLAAIDAGLRAKYGINSNQTAVGLLDLKGLRLAVIHPDRIEYAASIPKIGILLAYFELHPQAATNLAAETRHDLGLMIKASDNQMATRFSEAMGIANIQKVINSYGFYDVHHGGGLWFGKHYGKLGERIGDPIADDSHAATIRQLLRFYLLLEQGKLVSPAASRAMLNIFASPDIPPDDNKFVRGLQGRYVWILRKSGSWEDWLHDSAIIIGPNRFYILAALTHHPKGDEYLVDLAKAVDDLMSAPKTPGS